jgi:hypothetical protein
MEGPFLDPGVPDGEETAYRGLVDGEVAGEGVHVVHASPESYRQSLETTILADASYSASIEWRRSGGQMTAETYSLEAFYRGQPVSAEKGWFRGVRALGWGGALEAYPRDLSPLLGCALALRGLDFRQGARRSLSLWLASTVYWEIETRVEKVEPVILPLGSVRAWRVRVWPHFGHVAGALDRLVALLLPPFVLHFEEGGAHRFLRFEFPTGPFPWNPRAVIEATG